MSESLCERKEAFCRALAAGGSGAAAARAAGYAAAGARTQAWRLLQEPAVRRRLRALRYAAQEAEAALGARLFDHAETLRLEATREDDTRLALKALELQFRLARTYGAPLGALLDGAPRDPALPDELTEPPAEAPCDTPCDEALGDLPENALDAPAEERSEAPAGEPADSQDGEPAVGAARAPVRDPESVSNGSDGNVPVAGDTKSTPKASSPATGGAGACPRPERFSTANDPARQDAPMEAARQQASASVSIAALQAGAEEGLRAEHFPGRWPVSCRQGLSWCGPGHRDGGGDQPWKAFARTHEPSCKAPPHPSTGSG